MGVSRSRARYTHRNRPRIVTPAIATIRNDAAHGLMASTRDPGDGGDGSRAADSTSVFMAGPCYRMPSERSAEPRLHDGLGEIPAVLEVLRFLGFSGGSSPHRHRHLDDSGVLPQAFDEDLGRPELVLLENELSERLHPGGPVPVGDICDPDPRHQRDQFREEPNPHMAEVALLLKGTQDPRSLNHVSLPPEDGPDYRGEL